MRTDVGNALISLTGQTPRQRRIVQRWWKDNEGDFKVAPEDPASPRSRKPRTRSASRFRDQHESQRGALCVID